MLRYDGASCASGATEVCCGESLEIKKNKVIVQTSITGCVLHHLITTDTTPAVPPCHFDALTFKDSPKHRQVHQQKGCFNPAWKQESYFYMPSCLDRQEDESSVGKEMKGGGW